MKISPARVAATAGAFVAAGLGATLVNGRVRQHRRLRRGEDVEFGSVHSTPSSIQASDGVSLNVEVDEADRKTPVVVFVHGWVCTLDSWHYQRLAMRGAVRMVFMDLRSHGRSGRSTERHATLAQMADDLRTVIEQVAPRGPVVLVGHSMGGMAVMQLAQDDPEFFARRVQGVALIGTSSGKLMRGSPAFRRLVPLLRVASPVLDWGRSFNSYSVIKRWGLGPRAESRHVDMADEMILRAPTHVLMDFYPNFVSLDLRPSLPALATTHCVVVGGTDDQLTPISHARRLHDAIADSKLIEVEGAGHMIMLEAHDEVTEAIEDVVDLVRKDMDA